MGGAGWGYSRFRKRRWRESGGPRVLGHGLRWLPFVVGVLWLTYQATSGDVRPDLYHGLIAGLTGAGWLLGRGLPVTALLWSLLQAPLVHHFTIVLPQVREALDSGPGYVRLEGTLRDVRQQPPDSGGGLALLLTETRVWRQGRAWQVAEVAVRLPRGNPWGFSRGGIYRLGGRATPGTDCPAAVPGRRLCLHLSGEEHHRHEVSLLARQGESLRARLRNRAAYYLPPEPLAVYLPVVLGLRERGTPEARDLAGVFRRVGVAHLFAISGLHVGLLYLIFLGLPRGGYRLALGFLPLRQGWVHATPVFRLGALLLVWGYVALIGFPVSAVRAALMGSLLVLSQYGGLRAHPVLVLGLAALVILAPAPGQIYDISFQMSFLAYAFLLCALGTFRPISHRTWREGASSLTLRWIGRLGDGVAINLWLTAWITLGMWPLMAAYFEHLSFVAFIGNLVMVPLLGFLVLPLGVAALGISLWNLDTVIGGNFESTVFAALEAGLEGWTLLARWLDHLSGALVVTGSPGWPVQLYAAYYAAVLAGVLGLGHLKKSRRLPAGKSAAEGD